MGSCQVVSTTIQWMIRVKHFLGAAMFIYHTKHTQSFVSLNTESKQTGAGSLLNSPSLPFQGAPCPEEAPSLGLLPAAAGSWVSLLQPFSDSITNTFLWKVGELFLNLITHSCNQSIAQPRIHQGLWGNPPPTQLGFCSTLIGMARCCAVITQRYVNCGCHLANMNAKLLFTWASSRARVEGCPLWRR